MSAADGERMRWDAIDDRLFQQYAGKQAGILVVLLLRLGMLAASRYGLTGEEAQDCAACFAGSVIALPEAELHGLLGQEGVSRKLKSRATGMARNAVRRSRRHSQRELCGSAAGSAFTDAVVVRHPDPERALMMTDLIRHVNAAIEKLPPGQRRLFDMRYIEGLSPVEIARLVGAPRNAVDQSLFRARQSLQSHLLRQGYSAEDVACALPD